MNVAGDVTVPPQRGYGGRRLGRRWHTGRIRAGSGSGCVWAAGEQPRYVLPRLGEWEARRAGRAHADIPAEPTAAGAARPAPASAGQEICCVESHVSRQLLIVGLDYDDVEHSVHGPPEPVGFKGLWPVPAQYGVGTEPGRSRHRSLASRSTLIRRLVARRFRLLPSVFNLTVGITRTIPPAVAARATRLRVLHRRGLVENLLGNLLRQYVAGRPRFRLRNTAGRGCRTACRVRGAGRRGACRSSCVRSRAACSRAAAARRDRHKSTDSRGHCEQPSSGFRSWWRHSLLLEESGEEAGACRLVGLPTPGRP